MVKICKNSILTLEKTFSAQAKEFNQMSQFSRYFFWVKSVMICG